MSTTRDVLAQWKIRCGRTSFVHHRVQAIYSKRHVNLGILLLVCTTATGTSSFADIGQSTAFTQAFIVVFTLTAGVLAGIQTFLDYKTLSEAHKSAASGWEKLRWEAERLLASNEGKNEIEPDILKKFEKQVEEARKQSPTIHNDLWDKESNDFEPSNID